MKITASDEVESLRLRIAELEVENSRLKRVKNTLRALPDVSSLHSEQVYATIFETAGTAMAIDEDDTSLILVNREFEKLSGFSRKQLYGRSWTHFIDIADRDRIVEYHRSRRKGPELAPATYECRFKDRHGDLRDILVNTKIIPDTGQTVTSILDISGFKQAAKALDESEKKFRTLFHNSQDLFYIVDVQGRFLEVNEKTSSLLGYSLEEMKSLSITDLLEEQDLGRAVKSMAYILKFNTGRRPLDFMLRKKDGGHVWVEATGVRMDEEGRPSTILGIARDITRRKRVEENLKKARKELEELRISINSD